MHVCADWQGAFAKALLNPAEATPAGLQDPYGEPTLKRFAIYRNSVVSGLIEALKASFPAVCRIAGDEFFKAMARLYIVQHPPQSPVLLEYGETFAAFVEGFEPAASLPYLGDIGRIERAWLEAYHAPEATPFSSSTFASISPEQLPGLRFHLHPSLRLIRSRFPAFTIWSTNIEGGTPIAVDLEAGGENVLLCRQRAGVEVYPIADVGVEFVQSLADGKSVMEATAIALSFDKEFDPSALLGKMSDAGCFVAYRGDSVLVANSQRVPIRKTCHEASGEFS
jgi:Putative DNA-binding domain